tara:strand:- start:673 stop:912 length:240 start_codon:yes stop_codon:yes gene_type:complete
MIEKEIIIKIRVDEEIAKKENTFLNYNIGYYLDKNNKRKYDVDEFISHLINHLETDNEIDGKPYNHLKEWGYEIFCKTN